MAVILEFDPSAARTKRLSDASHKPSGQVVFFTGVRYERLASIAAVKPAPQPSPSKPQRLKSKA